jgi:uncharacterized membrane protein
MALLELVLGFILLIITLTLPGYFLTLAFFPKKEEIDAIERFTFSLVFSIAVIPLIILIENQVFAIPIDFFSSIGTVLILIIFGLLVYAIRTQKVPFPKALGFLFPRIKKEESVEIFFLKPLMKKK